MPAALPLTSSVRLTALRLVGASLEAAPVSAQAEGLTMDAAAPPRPAAARPRKLLRFMAAKTAVLVCRIGQTPCNSVGGCIKFPIMGRSRLNLSQGVKGR